MPSELAAVDALLDDPVFFQPYRAHFDPIWGRPSTPIETYLRMMFLSTATSSATRRSAGRLQTPSPGFRFCRIPFGEAVAHPTTLMKITTRCGEGVIKELNDSLLKKAAAGKVLKLDK
jgi:transposase, IS5 family